MARLDHLVVAAADLDAGAAWLEQRLGAALAPGGRHAAMGTHNRLLRLGERLYLELIAIDPDAPSPTRPRWFGLDEPGLRRRLQREPVLLHWVAASDDIVNDAARLGYDAADILSMTRGDFRWRITVPAEGRLRNGGLLPSLIQWDVPAHPADRLPDAGCRLMKLEAFCHDHATLRAHFASVGLERAIDLQAPPPGEGEEWVAYLETPCGLVELGSDVAG